MKAPKDGSVSEEFEGMSSTAGHPSSASRADPPGEAHDAPWAIWWLETLKRVAVVHDSSVVVLSFETVDHLLRLLADGLLRVTNAASDANGQNKNTFPKDSHG